MALTDNLIGYWKLNETSGTRVDAHSNGYDLTDNNTVGYATGVIGNAANFVSANSEYLSRSYSGMVPTTNATLSFWLKHNDGGGNMGIAELGLFGTDPVQPWFVQCRNGEIWAWIDGQNFNYGYTTDAALSSSSFYHVVVRYDGGGSGDSGRLKISINDTNKTLSFNGTIPASMSAMSQGAFVIGRGLWYANGDVDEFGYWDRTLTNQEVTDLYNGGAGLAYPFSSSSIKTWNGVANASVKTWDGVARASVKTWNGIA